MDYGISNKRGRVPDSERHAILGLAKASGVTWLDTAAVYGDAEELLGAAQVGRSFQVVTKLPRVPPDLDARELRTWVTDRVGTSCANLRRERLDGLLVHSASDLLGKPGAWLWDALTELRQQGRVGEIGASVYSGDEINALLERFDPTLVQVPLSALDQRLIAGGYLQRLKQRGVEIHARSIFLQGLLLMDPDHVPIELSTARVAVSQFRVFAGAMRMTPLQAAVAFVNAVPEVDTAIVGVTSAAELEEILKAAELTPSLADFAPCASDDPILLNPVQWRHA